MEKGFKYLGAQISTTAKMQHQVPNERMARAATMANKMSRIGISTEAKQKSTLGERHA